MCRVVSDFLLLAHQPRVIRHTITPLSPDSCPRKYCICSSSMILYPGCTFESLGEILKNVPSKLHLQIFWFNYFPGVGMHRGRGAGEVGWSSALAAFESTPGSNVRPGLKAIALNFVLPTFFLCCLLSFTKFNFFYGGSLSLL